MSKLVRVDCLPIIEHLERADWKLARDWYHRFFFAQPEKPERMISADPLGWYDKLPPDLMGAEAYDDPLAIWRNGLMTSEASVLIAATMSRKRVLVISRPRSWRFCEIEKPIDRGRLSTKLRDRRHDQLIHGLLQNKRI
ncbi:hypothetical protein J2X76_006168 [Neorhizobium sp. 2083]|nr:hypothetical protein [Neorhizobium sp. 2083]